MPVPNFQDFLLPFLRCIEDGGDRHVAEISDGVAELLGLSPDERGERIASGNQTTYRNRTYWAKLYLSKAGLADSVGRGRVRITDRGRAVLGEQPDRLNIAYLRRFPEFLEFLRARRAAATAADEPLIAVADETPEERLVTSYSTIREAVAADILDRIRSCSPAFFEHLVVDVLVAMGYGGSRLDAGRKLGRTGDGGVDGLIKQDKLGLESIYIQAKRWQNPVGASIVRDFAGALEGARASKGVLLTTSRFTADAADYVTRISKTIILIDGEQLARLMFDHDVGAVEVGKYVVKRVDADYFDEA